MLGKNFLLLAIFKTRPYVNIMLNLVKNIFEDLQQKMLDTEMYEFT